MSTAAELPIGHVVCQNCDGSGETQWIDHDLLRISPCVVCHGECHILDPIISEWNDPATTPARLIEMIGDGADEGKLREWREETVKHCVCYEGSGRELLQYRPQRFADEMSVQSDEYPCGAIEVAANFLRCLFPCPAMPREMVECFACAGWGGDVHTMFGPPVQVKCKVCKGKKVIPAPLIDPLWRSASVLDLARAIRGSDVIQYSGSYGQVKECRMIQPNNDPFLYNVLADALLDSGAQGAAWDEMERHLRQPMHIARQCHVIDLILSGG